MPPSISLVTPSYNYCQYLDNCIRSILDQGYPDLEYLILDGGSTDGSVDLIRGYEDRLAYWHSHADDGPYAAVEEGLNRSTGEIMGWLSADDMLAPGALQTVAEVFEQHPQVDWITSFRPGVIHESGEIEHQTVRPASKRAFMDGLMLPFADWRILVVIQQESTFWRRSLWERAGARLDTSLRLAGDFELWARFFGLAELVWIGGLVGRFRFHKDQRSQQWHREYHDEAAAVLCRYGWTPPTQAFAWRRRQMQRMRWRLRRLPPSVFNCMYRWIGLEARTICQRDPVRPGAWLLKAV